MEDSNNKQNKDLLQSAIESPKLKFINFFVSLVPFRGKRKEFVDKGNIDYQRLLQRLHSIQAVTVRYSAYQAARETAKPHREGPA